MRILFIHGHMAPERTWRQVADRLVIDGIGLRLMPQWLAAEKAGGIMARPPEVLLADLYHDLPGYQEVLDAGKGVRLRAGLNQKMPQGFSNLAAPELAKLAAYLQKLSAENYYQAMRYLAGLAGMGIEHREPVAVRTHGIHHPHAPAAFDEPEHYLRWLEREKGLTSKRNLVGLICYHSQLAEANAAEIDALILTMPDHGLIPMCIFCEGMLDSALPLARRYPWLEYLRAAKPDLCALVNLLAGRFLSQPEEAVRLAGLDVPVFQGLRLHGKSREDWAIDPQGIANHSLVYAIAQPEMAGVIEPTLLATDQPDSATGGNSFQPEAERMDLLCRRIRRWQRLRELPNHEKRVTVVLHNNPCKGVEATVGMAVGLDALASLGRVVAALRKAGYDVGDAPEGGNEILRLIQERKAHCEFRWTTVDEIVRKGGDIHRMREPEYQPWFQALPEDARQKVLADWDEFPGQGMAWEDGEGPCLLITGLIFGKLKILVQPKRGCYGPKCTGEVCRILHDPGLSPPHHWLATYKYIQDTSDVVIHFGAEGALEYLPGKRAALGPACFPEISLGDLPNAYVYAMDIPGEGLNAKRRGRAIIIDHLAPVYRPVGLTETASRLSDLLGQYQHARDMSEAGRLANLKDDLLPILVDLKLVPEDYQGEEWEAKLDLAQRQIASLREALMPEGLHLLGRPPDNRQISLIIALLLKKGQEGLPSLEDLASRQRDSAGEMFEDATSYIESLLKTEAAPQAETKLIEWSQGLRKKLGMASLELGQLLKTLDGRYLEPNLGGSLLMGQTQALPSGRNFFAIDLLRLPTPAAWQVGQELADELLRKYLDDEGGFPRTVGVSLWSSDAFKSHGEVLCQILHLMGARPVWEANGRVRRVEAISLDELHLKYQGRPLPRPRVDVLVQTSGILRDMVPGFIDLIDRAAVMLAGLDEPSERNFIRKHTEERMAELAEQESASGADLRRLASFRVFSSAPGTFGLGVELALDASAWEDQDDLAEVYVNWGGFAYGAGGQSYGVESQKLLARSLRDLDVSYMRQFSPEYDLVDCGGYASFQGGMAAAAQAMGGKGPRCYFGAGTGGERARIGDLGEELETALRAKLLNQAWLEHMKKHGHQGAEAVSSRINHLFKWSATTAKVEQRLFEAVADCYLHDEANMEWLRETNPHALEELTRRLLEADSRGMWQARSHDWEALQAAMLVVEGDMEEAMGEVTSEFQGSGVEILTAEQVEKWNPRWRIKSQNS